MVTPRWPTFGQLLHYLRDLGFSTGPGEEGYVRCEHPDDDVYFVFRDRDPNTPARETELLSLRMQLTYRGFVSDEEFARFWNRSVQPNPVPVENPG